jgi:four helix bundle protein
MAVRHYRDLIAWQTADEFKREVFKLLQANKDASNNRRYRHQLIGAASGVAANIAEGFLRCAPAEFCRFIDYGLGSLVEAETPLMDGVALGYFTADSCTAALQLARRCLTACVRLKQSQRRYQSERSARNKTEG